MSDFQLILSRFIILEHGYSDEEFGSDDEKQEDQPDSKAKADDKSDEEKEAYSDDFDDEVNREQSDEEDKTAREACT